MVNWMKIAAAATRLGGNIASNAIARRREKRKIKSLQKQRAENKQWYDQRYNEDATQRADAQALLNTTLQSVRERNRAAAGKQAVMGGTDESVAATKEQGNQLMADAVSQINSEAANRKDDIEQQYRATDTQLQADINDVRDQRSARIGKSVVGYANTAADMMENAQGFLN
jgi:hypothetical protein